MIIPFLCGVVVGVALAFFIAWLLRLLFVYT
jgi:hypothetical protein